MPLSVAEDFAGVSLLDGSTLLWGLKQPLNLLRHLIQALLEAVNLRLQQLDPVFDPAIAFQLSLPSERVSGLRANLSAIN